LKKEPAESESAMKEMNMINSEINFGFENKYFSEAILYTLIFFFPHSPWDSLFEICLLGGM